jgi:hypothetical protein
MNQDLDNLMREKTCNNLSSPTVKENSSINDVNQSIDKLMPSKENNVIDIESSAAKESSRGSILLFFIKNIQKKLE